MAAKADLVTIRDVRGSEVLRHARDLRTDKPKGIHGALIDSSETNKVPIASYLHGFLSMGVGGLMGITDLNQAE